MTTGYADVHQLYTDLGWAGVIKLAAGTKFPPPNGFTGADGMYPSSADRHTWAEDEPDGNTALRMADGFIGIDMDCYNGKTGQATVAEGETRWGALADSKRSTSRTDGSCIRVYRVPTGIKFAGKLEFPELGIGDVEIIQPHHRYVVAWPSIHDKTGDTYYWHDADGTVTTPPNADEIPDLPAKWVEALQVRETASSTDGLGADGPYNVRAALTDGEPSRRVSSRLGEAIVACQGSSRHDSIRNHVLALLRYGKQGDTGVNPALRALQRAFVAAVTPDRPGGHDQAIEEFRAFLFGERVGQLLALKDYDDDDAQDGNSDEEHLEAAVAYRVTRLRVDRLARRQLDDEERPPAQPPAVTSLDTFLAQPDSPNRYRIDRLAPIGGRVLMAAQYKAGKTTVVGNLLRALADDEPFLGAFDVMPARRIVLFDDELGPDMLRRWLRAQGIVNTAAVADVVLLRGKLASFNPTDDRNRAQWATRLRDLGTDYVILDCLSPVLTALGLDPDKQTGIFLGAFDALLYEAGVEDSLTVHHMGHSGERSRGDSRLQDWPDAIWRVVRENDDPASARYFSAYGRDVNVGEGRLNFDTASRRLTYAAGSRGDAKTEAALAAVVELLAATGGLGLSGRAIEEHLGTDHTQKAIRAAKRLAVERGLVSTADGERGAKVHRIAKPCAQCGKPMVGGQSERHASCPISEHSEVLL